MWQYQNTDELYHHGILGMKWGVRRYQNADGTLTPAGRRKAGKLAEKYAKVTGKKLIVKKKSVEPTKEKSISEMTDKELYAKINRLNLEQNYKRLLASTQPAPKEKKVSAGRRFVNSIKSSVATGAQNGISEGVKRIVADLISNSAKSIKSSGNKAKANVQSAVATANKETNKAINKGVKETNKASKKASKDNYKDFIKETNNIIKSYNKSNDKLGSITVNPKVYNDLEDYIKKKK